MICSNFISQFERYHAPTFPYLRISFCTPWIRHYCFISSSPCSTNLVISVQAIICKIYMYRVWRFSNVHFLHGNHVKSCSFSSNSSNQEHLSPETALSCVLKVGLILSFLQPTWNLTLMFSIRVQRLNYFNCRLHKQKGIISIRYKKKKTWCFHSQYDFYT